MNKEAFLNQQEREKGGQEGKGPLPEGEIPLRIEPKRALKLELDKPTEVSPKKTVEGKEEKEEKKEKTTILPKLAKAKLEVPIKAEEKSNRFFRGLFVLSLAFMTVTVGLLLLPLLNIPIPPFLTPVINFVSSK